MTLLVYFYVLINKEIPAFNEIKINFNHICGRIFSG